MTATRDRQYDPDVVSEGTPWDERSLFGSVRGLPWWGAVLLALVVSLVAAFIDMTFNKQPGQMFQVVYLIACVAAVLVVRRRNLFGPMVQAPLILVITVPVVVGLSSSGGGLTAKALAVSTPLINAFPMMAVTTAATVIIGAIRFGVQRRPATTRQADDRSRQADERSRPADDRGRQPARDGRQPAGARRPAGSGGTPRGGQSDRAVPPRDRTRVDPSRGRAATGGDPRGGARGGGGNKEGGRPIPGRGGAPGADRGQRGRMPREGGRPDGRDPGRRPPQRRRDDDPFD